MNRQNTLTLLLLALLTLSSRAVAQVQNLRAATASSYIERGNQWLAKGEYERAEADYTLAIASDPTQAGDTTTALLHAINWANWQKRCATLTAHSNSTRAWLRRM